VNEVSEAWIRAVRAFGAGRRQIIAKAILPGAFPAVMAGIRLGIGRSIVSLVAAEMYVSIFGIGRLIQVYSNSGKAAPIFVLIGIISTFGLVCVNALRTLETRLAPWRGGR
jgi:ABC-type nitrate/sulfonate/bicarbonate transport system permease component